MASRLLERIKKLELRFSSKPPPPWVVEMEIGDTEEKAVARYFAKWRMRPGEPKRYLITALPMLTPEQWVAEYGNPEEQVEGTFL